MSDSVIMTGMVCFSVIFIFLALGWFRLRMEQQKTFRAMLETSSDPEGLIRERLKGAGRKADLRRGILILVLGLLMTFIFKGFGGKAWILGLIPIVIGLVYLVYWKLNAKD